MTSKKTKQATRSQGEISDVSRRTVLSSAITATSVSLIPLVTSSCTTAVQSSQPVFSIAARAILESLVDRIIPQDENGPGALQAGVVVYINNALDNWNREEKDSLEEGLMALSSFARIQYNQDFMSLPNTNKDVLLRAMEDGNIDGFPNSTQVFSRLHRLTLEGMFSDPYYGGNQNYAGWDLIGYPGAVMASSPDMQRMGGRIPPLHTSAYGSDFDGD